MTNELPKKKTSLILLSCIALLLTVLGALYMSFAFPRLCNSASTSQITLDLPLESAIIESIHNSITSKESSPIRTINLGRRLKFVIEATNEEEGFTHFTASAVIDNKALRVLKAKWAANTPPDCLIFLN
ncbi:MAG: hypothetical protein GX221_00635 [Candidatus Riflebacteria bacterium]|nr:hypothetical protein [Candidatus Riflebacteria bacterium]